MISSKIAQTIVDKTMSIINYRINIMDSSAKIIASSDSSRIGNYHEGAAKVIATGKSYEVEYYDTKTLKGVKPGISLPITYGKEVIGVVGITGEPAEVRKYGELVRHTAELMLEQALLKEEMHLKGKAKEGFIRDLLLGNWDEGFEFFYHRAEMLGYNLNIPRIVIVAELNITFQEELSLMVERSSDFDDIVKFQKFKDKIQKEVRSRLNAYQEASTYFVGVNHLAVLVPIRAEISWKEQYNMILKVARDIITAVKQKLNVNAKLGIGNPCEDWKCLYKSYLEALHAIQLGKVYSPDINIYYFKDQLTEFSLASINKEVRNNYCEDVLGELITLPLQDYKRELIYTLQVYFANNMSTTKASKKLFIHRNTIMFRLNKIKKITGYDPQQFRDAFKLRLALMFWEIMELSLQEEDYKKFYSNNIDSL